MAHFKPPRTPSKIKIEEKKNINTSPNKLSIVQSNTKNKVLN